MGIGDGDARNVLIPGIPDGDLFNPVNTPVGMKNHPFSFPSGVGDQGPVAILSRDTGQHVWVSARLKEITSYLASNCLLARRMKKPLLACLLPW